MNSKRCKKLRRTLREGGVSVGHKEYAWDSSRKRYIVLKPGCGRFQYQFLKQKMKELHHAN